MHAHLLALCTSYTFDQASQLYFEEAHGFYYSADTNKVNYPDRSLVQRPRLLARRLTYTCTTQYCDGNKRIWYAFNNTTRQFIVSDSGATAALSMGMAQPASQMQWQELVDPTTNNTYYYNGRRHQGVVVDVTSRVPHNSKQKYAATKYCFVNCGPNAADIWPSGYKIHSYNLGSTVVRCCAYPNIIWGRSFPIIVAAGSSLNDRGGWVSGGAGVVVVALVLSKSMHAYNCMYAYVNTNADTYCVSMSV